MCIRDRGRKPNEPSTRTLPRCRSCGVGSPTTTEMKDDFPVPLRPTSPTFSPAPTTKEASDTSVRSPISIVSDEPTITAPVSYTHLDVYKRQDLDRGFITVAASKAKTRRRRLVPISENLKLWLTPIRQASGPICVHVCAQHAAREKCEGFKWAKNGLRHSFISYRLAILHDTCLLYTSRCV